MIEISRHLTHLSKKLILRIHINTSEFKESSEQLFNYLTINIKEKK